MDTLLLSLAVNAATQNGFDSCKLGQISHGMKEMQFKDEQESLMDNIIYHVSNLVMSLVNK